MDNTKDYEKLNDPQRYPDGEPYLLVDANGETIISRTAKKINEGRISPYKIDMMEVTLYIFKFVRQLLEKIDTDYMIDVAQAIDDEVDSHEREDGPYTRITSLEYGTGKQTDFGYSYDRPNWGQYHESVDAIGISKRVLDKRQKEDTFLKKVKQRREEDANKALHETYGNVITPWVRQSLIDSISQEKMTNEQENDAQKEISSLKRENEILLKRLADQEQQLQVQGESEPEQAFNAQTGNPCFTSTQMGILLYAVGHLTEDKPPGKTTLGDIVEKISGYKATNAMQNLKGMFRENDKNKVAEAIESKLPTLAAKVRRL